MPEKPIFPAEIAGRTIMVKPPTDTQFILMGRASQKAGVAVKEDRYEDAIYLMAEALDIIDTLIVEDDDRAYLTKLMAKGELEIQDLLEAIGTSAPKQAPTNGPATRVTRRGRSS